MLTVDDAKAEMRAQVRRIARTALDRDLARFDALQLNDSAQRARLRAVVVAASIRRAIAEAVPEERADNAGRLVIWLPGIVGLIWFSLAARGNLATRLLLFVVGGLIAVAILKIALKVIPSDRRVSRLGGTAGTAFLTGVPVLSITLTLVNIQRLSKSAASLLAGWDTVWAMVLMLGATTVAGIAVGSVRANRLCRPYDVALLEAVNVTADLQAHDRHWRSLATVKRTCGGLQFLAGVAERDLSMKARSRTAERSVRRTLRQEALRIGATIRAHQATAITASRRQESTTITDFLMTLIDGLAARDRTALLANAPDEVPPRDTLRRVARWLWPPVALTAAGIVIPLLPGFPNNAALAESIRWTLLVPAVLLLVTRQTDVISRVEAAIGKAFPGR